MAKVNHSQPLVPAIDVAERPIDTMLDRLRQAHATLDLISVLTSNAKTGHTVLGYLYEGTLHTATHRAMLRVSEAIAAADRLAERFPEAMAAERMGAEHVC